MGPTKAPDEYGLPALFYQNCCHIIGDEVTRFCLQTLNEGMGLQQINATRIVLIPKTDNPTTMMNFRPISLCNVLYKIIAKAIANRFRGVIEKCIDEAQSAFVPGRLIPDNVLLAYEILHTYHQKRVGQKSFMVVKLDLSKVYDRVEWNFIKEVMGGKEVLIKSVLQSILTVGRRDGISIWEDHWIPGVEPDAWNNRNGSEGPQLVSKLIDQTIRTWKSDVMSSTFQDAIAQQIMQIALAGSPHNDLQVWNGESSEERLEISGNGLPGSFRIAIINNVDLFTAGCGSSGLEEKRLTSSMGSRNTCIDTTTRATIQFDAAFGSRSYKSASGLVVRSRMGELLALKTVVHTNVPSPFAAEAYQFIQRVDNVYAHNLAKESLRKNEETYHRMANVNQHQSQQEGRWRNSPD
ncbi:hypothetical protein J1N35_026982 [Gossypium stocksii]|uniref:Reverse transcriptase domain-containing protein n=1 Tax=Gossypium stocksii TaxID=47602 RepID=A0A9D3V8X6_9ROSI|nr:hypothetical protein J1N35_026982 [Gossypium stocksii]